MMTWQIRAAHADDAEDISRLIVRTLRETSARDYSPDVIERVERSFDPACVRELIAKQDVFVATSGQRIGGTASLDGSSVRTVFVTPEDQGKGVGRQLMYEVERVAREAGVGILKVPSSVTAEQFYFALGFKPIRDVYHGNERTILMERVL